MSELRHGEHGDSMSDPSYYVRYKGKVLGPYSADELAAAVKRNKVTRAHSLSTDREIWFPANELAGLFPATERAPVSAAEPAGDYAVSEQLPEFAEDAPPVPVSPPAEHGTIQWPCPECGQELAVSAALTGETAECPFCGARSTVPRAMGSSVPTNQSTPTVRERSDSRTARINLGLGVTIGTGFLVLMQFPIQAANDQLVFWWNFLAKGLPRATILIILVLAASIALIVGSTLLRGVARGAMFVGIGLIGVITLCASLQTAFILWLVPFSIQTSAAGWRHVDQGGLGPRVMSCVSGGVSCVASLVLLIVLLDTEDSNSVVLESWAQITAFILLVLGICSGITAGILGVASIRPRYSRRANEAVQILATAAAFAPFLGLFLLVSDLVSVIAPPSGAWLIVLVIRAVLVLVFLFYLIAYGLIELSQGVARQARTSSIQSNSAP